MTTLKRFALAVCLQLLALGLPAPMLAGCGAGATVAKIVRPSGFGVRNDARFGRCYSAGAAVADQIEVTAHLCARFMDGGQVAEVTPDASAPAPADQTAVPAEASGAPVLSSGGGSQ